MPPGRVMAGEPGRSVIGGPVGGVKTKDEAEGSRVTGELPIVAMTGLGAGAGEGAAIGPRAGVWPGLDES